MINEIINLADDIKNNVDKKIPNFEMYINLIHILLSCYMLYLLIILIISYQNNNPNQFVFLQVATIGTIMLVIFYIKNMSRINLFLKSQWASLNKAQHIIFIITILTIILNAVIANLRKNDFIKVVNVLIICTGIIISMTVAKIIYSIRNFYDYIKNKDSNQFYYKLNKKLSYAKLDELNKSIL
uniref:Uncharacterized protein n=1 Tax=viral metagenome TaxID=1070528 RepID=A0A6C0M0K0_9ZZZZ